MDVGSSLEPSAQSGRPQAWIEPGKVRRQKRRLLALALAGCALGVLANVAASELRRPEALGSSVVSGRAGLKQTSAGRYQRWRKQRVEVKIDSSVAALGVEARAAIEDAFVSWADSGVELPSADFSTTRGTKLSTVPDGVSTVLYAPIDIEGHKNDLAVTIAFSDPVSGEIVEADIVINSKHPFAILTAAPAKSGSDQADDERDTVGEARCVARSDGARCGGKYDLQNVLTHEVGHFFGLSEDVAELKATMYECISACETHKRAITNDDQLAVSELYSEGFASETDADAGGCGGARLSPRGALGGAASVAMLLALGVCVLRRRLTTSV